MAAETIAPPTTNGQKKPRRPNLQQIHALPTPIRTFPLPAFYPNNPISFIHLAWAWASQVMRPPPKEPAVVHTGVWSPETASVIVKDEASMRALWEQGFYGKGNFSRSEPQWLKREQQRRGSGAGYVSEIATAQRREVRFEAKWERARLEQAAIRETRREEARLAELRKQSALLPAAPTGPLELLALPNSALGETGLPSWSLPPNGLKTPNGKSIPGLWQLGRVQEPSPAPSDDSQDSEKKKKNVRFSPEVQSTTFQQLDPPTPSLSPRVKDEQIDIAPEMANIEHLQLTSEEAFFLSFGLGVLTVVDPDTNQPVSPQRLLNLFRQYSFSPPHVEADDTLWPDDTFLVQYAVYHHFRSMGWVPRAGIKFGVDWLLYARGPAFDHAEFGLIVLPSYSDAWWKEQGRRAPGKSWHWMHKILRVLTQVFKSLVFVYVDVPPPPKFEAAMETGFAEALKLYRVREILVKRWSSNRNR